MLHDLHHPTEVGVDDALSTVFNTLQTSPQRTHNQSSTLDNSAAIERNNNRASSCHCWSSSMLSRMGHDRPDESLLPLLMLHIDRHCLISASALPGHRRHYRRLHHPRMDLTTRRPLSFHFNIKKKCIPTGY